MALVIDKPRDLETDLAASAFNLALVLYFHTHVLQSSLSHPTVVWAVGRLLELAERAQCLGYRQAWATWPYFMLGLHVSDPIHRQAVQARFRWMEETISIGNLFALREVLSELWDRRDRCEPVEWQQSVFVIKSLIHELMTKSVARSTRRHSFSIVVLLDNTCATYSIR
jgi:hypothetical protein